MELVYLWVESYKNIKKQGFNFSPRFRCSYDETTKELEVIDKEETKEPYLKDFFGENINITAIVGENGSGKTNILESLLIDFMSKDNKLYHVLSIFYNNKDNKIFYKELGVNVKIDKSYLYKKITNIADTGIFTFHYNYGIDCFFYNDNNLNFDKLYHKNDDYKTPILLQPNKGRNTIDIPNIDYLATRDILNFNIHKKISFDFIDKFFTPTKCKLKHKIENVYKMRASWKLKEENLLEELKCLSYHYIITKTLKKEENCKSEIVKDKEFKEQLKTIIDNKVETTYPLIEMIKKKKFDNLFDTSLHYKTEKIRQTFLFLEYLDTLKDFDRSLLEEQMLVINEHKELLKNLAPWIQIEFFNEKEISFYSLSYGQKFLVKFIYSLLNQLYNLSSHKEYTNIVLLLDEVELGLHPNWQKEYLSILIKILNTKIEGFSFKYNILCSTHSPFILSDIPKENIIFLEKGKQVYPFENGQTFGANIHTLLSHGFFMKDGLIGEFAKEKIQSIITYHEEILKKELTNKENKKQRDEEKENYEKEHKSNFWQIQSIIGDDYLKQVVKNHLIEIEKKVLGNKKAKQEEIDRLQKQIDCLKIQNA